MIWVDLPFLIYLSTQSKRKTFYGDLAGANDWTVFFELPELKEFSIKHFPQDICQTKKQVDAFVISKSKKICLVGPELTVPIEERIAFWNEKKTGKYEKMIADHGSPSWKLKCIVAEVCCRGIHSTFFQKSAPTLWIHLKGIENTCWWMFFG